MTDTTQLDQVDDELAGGGMTREYLGGIVAGLIIGAGLGALAYSYLNRKPCPCEDDVDAGVAPPVVSRRPTYPPPPEPATPAAASAGPVADVAEELTPAQKAALTRAANRAKATGELPPPTAERGPASPSTPLFPGVNPAHPPMAGPFGPDGPGVPTSSNGHH